MTYRRIMAGSSVVLLVIVILFSACEKEKFIPTVEISAEVKDYKVIIQTETTNAVSYQWDYGNGDYSEIAGSHDYTYDQSGDYTIKVIVRSGDGSKTMAEVAVHIETSLAEIISGGPAYPEGKTWVLSQVSIPGIDGCGLVSDDLPVIEGSLQVQNRMLALYGLGDEYSDEFIFYYDGTMSVNVKNEKALSGIIYGMIIDPGDLQPATEWQQLPLAAAHYNVPRGGRWNVSYKDYHVTAFNVLSNAEEPEDIVFSFPEGDPNKVARLDLSMGQYIGVLDHFAGQHPSLAVIKAVTKDKMQLAIGINNNVLHADKPTMMLHLTMEAKPLVAGE